MGNALKTPEPVFTLLATRPLGYEIRSYPSLLIAEVDNSNADNSNAFRTLAAYIGVFQKPANKQKGSGQAEGISMTAPVIMPQPTECASKAISMTAPVVQSGNKMQFVMPDKYKSIADLPEPTDPRVSLKEVPAKCVGVIQYPGKATNVMTQEKLNSLKEWLVKDKLLLEKDKNTVPWEYCGYDPPFKPGFLRRNEVWIDLKMKPEEINKKLAEADK